MYWYFPRCLPDVISWVTAKLRLQLALYFRGTPVPTPTPHPRPSRWKTSQPRRENKLPDPSMHRRNNTSASSGSLGNLPWFLHWTNQKPPRLSSANRSLRGEALPPPGYCVAIQTNTTKRRQVWAQPDSWSIQWRNLGRERKEGCAPHPPLNRPIKAFGELSPAADLQRFLLVNLSVAGVLL